MLSTDPKWVFLLSFLNLCRPLLTPEEINCCKTHPPATGSSQHFKYEVKQVNNSRQKLIKQKVLDLL